MDVGSPTGGGVSAYQRHLVYIFCTKFYDVNQPMASGACCCNNTMRTGNRSPSVLAACLTRYAQIEKECLVSVWECFEKYLVWLKNFKLVTDHKPLLLLMNKKDLHNVPICCQRLLMRLMRFKPTAEYAPGKSLTLADMLSRSILQCMRDTQM